MAHEQTAISTALHPPKVCKRFVDDVYFILIRTHSRREAASKHKAYYRKLVFLGTLLKCNSGKISVAVCRKPTITDQFLHYSSHHQASCKKVLLPPYTMENIYLSPIKITK